MKITLKTLQRETFDIDIDEELKVSDLKAAVAETKGAGYAAPTLKLIYAGKILNDESQLKEYNISTFVVVMITKPKPAPASAAAPAASTAPTPAVETPAAAAPAAPAPAAPATTAPAVAPAATEGETGTGDSMFVAGSAYHSAVTEMISMGFERDQIERAMHASFMNPHRAIEYLCNPSSMPAVPPPQAAAPAGGAPTPAAAPAATPSAATTPAAGGDQARNLEFLRNQPQFQMLRQMVSQDPQMLQSLLVQLGQANPQLLQAIQENPQQFISLLNEEGGGGGAPGAPGAEGGPPPGSVEISLSATEKEAIDRIKALGFPEHLVIQAYFACEKNENLAAEFLFSESYDNDS